ncbi:AMP-binding protein [Viridibacillus sp. YIM B01967]|uniref:AMP-binding protein n=1 Tax=Viridibacillus soli TaxID=2798301 RepID=A0ABS1H6Z7_9BACL|nr:AMP-binding protein [Viridibacillus soli]MBK3495184.1 AMP-binding protein [Viridibacillus soli]
MNIVDQIRSYEQLTPSKIAIQFAGASITYKDLIHSIDLVAIGLSSISTQKHCKVAIFMRNKVEFFEIFLGAIAAGFIPVPMDPKWSDKEISYVLGMCKPAVLFIDEEFEEKLLNNNCPIIFIGRSYSEWKQQFKRSIPTILHQPSTLFIGFTSGTTGTPKGFMRSHLSWIESFYATNDAFQIKQTDHVIAPGPLVHSMTLFAAIHTLFIGATFHLIDKFSPEKVVHVLQKVENMILYVVPTMIEGILPYLKQNASIYFAPKSILSSGAKWSIESKTDAQQFFPGSTIFEFYGSSEASFIAYVTAAEQMLKPQSVGKPFPKVNISIRRDDGSEVETDEIGQLFVSSEMMFEGYFDNEKETAKVLQNGWLALGDYASLDKDGYLYIAGRAKNMMISGGLNVFPEEVEGVLLAADEVSEVMVFGQFDTYWGEKIVAIIQWEAGKEMTHSQIKAYCLKHLATYKIPQNIMSVEQFTYTSSGKIARDKMKKQLLEAF